MRYGLSFVPGARSDFDGIRIALEMDYGIPYLFDSVQAASAAITEFFGSESCKYSVEITEESKLIPMLRMVVEFYAGRIRIQRGIGGRVHISIHDETKQTYETIVAGVALRRQQDINRRKLAMGVKSMQFVRRKPRP
jgi:hypothetical protein